MPFAEPAARKRVGPRFLDRAAKRHISSIAIKANDVLRHIPLSVEHGEAAPDQKAPDDQAQGNYERW